MTKQHKRRHSRGKHALPKGAHRLPNGNYVVTTYYRTAKGRTLRVDGVHRAEPDAKKVAQALIDIVLEEQQRDRAA
jgi:hypothetical protein